MPKNTLILLCILAVFTALVVGVNIGRSFQPHQITTTTISPTPVAPSPTPTIALSTYSSSYCGISFSYPKNLTKIEAQTGGAMFIDSVHPNQSIALACQKEIPRVPLTPDKIETIKIGSISATVYHDASAKDGTPVDKLIFTHPKNKMDIFISGLGDSFVTILSSLKVE